MNLLEIAQEFPEHVDCLKYLESIRWGSKIECPYCFTAKTSPSNCKKRHHCNGCNRSFSVLVGTIFHNTKLDLRKWFLAISLIIQAKKGISSLQLARSLSINKNTAWSVQMRIRAAMKAESQGFLFNLSKRLECEINKPTNVSSRRISAIQKSRVPYRIKHEYINYIQRYIDRDLWSEPISDEHSKLILEEFPEQDISFKIAHSSWFENVQSLLKRGIIGQYHKVSKAYLKSYKQEFNWRNKHKLESNKFGILINSMIKTNPAFL